MPGVAFENEMRFAFGVSRFMYVAYNVKTYCTLRKSVEKVKYFKNLPEKTVL